MTGKNVSRRSFLGIAVAAVVAGVVAGVGGYYAGALSAPTVAPTTVTQTSTVTSPPVTSTVTTGGGPPVTTTVTSPVTTTVTSPPVTTTMTQPPTTTTVTTTATTEAPPPREAKIGTAFAITGSYAQICYKYTEWHQAWVKYTNEVQGGVYVKQYGRKVPVNLVWYDDTSSIDEDVTLMEKLATSDNADILIGPWGSLNTLRASTVAEKEHVPMLGAEAATLDLYTRGFNWYLGGGPYLPDWSKNYFAMLEYYNAIGKTNFKTIALLADDSSYSSDLLYGAAQYAQAAGLQVVANEKTPLFTQDFSPIVTKFKAVNPDIVFYANDGSPNLGLLKQSAELGLKPKEFHIGIIMWPEVMAAPDLYQRVTSETETPKAYADTKYLDLMNSVGITDIYTLPYVYIRYRAFEIALRGIEEAGVLDRAKINDALWSLKFWGPGGWIQPIERDFQGRHVRGLMPKTMWTIQVQKGPQVQCVWPSEVADSSYVPP